MSIEDGNLNTDQWDANRKALRLSRKSASLDAFGRGRISQLETIFDSKLSIGKLPLFWDELVAGTGASSVHVELDSCCRLSVSADGDRVIRQTKQRWNYQPGKSQLGLFTFRMPVADGVSAKVGMFHGDYEAPQTPHDGVYFEVTDGIAYVCIVKGTTADGVVGLQRVPQSEWNMDPLDGTGESRRTADWSKCQILQIDYQWLGVGGVRFGFEVDSVMVYVHEFKHAGIVESVYMHSGTQPVRYEIRSTGGAGHLDQICSTVSSEGGTRKTGITASEDTNGNLISCAAGSIQMLLAVRIDPDEPDVQLIIENIYALNTAANTSIRWALLLNPTIVGTPNFVDGSVPPLQVWRNAGTNITMTGGVQLASGYSSREGKQVNQVTDPAVGPGIGLTGTPDVIALGIESIGGTSTCSGGIGVRQLV